MARQGHGDLVTRKTSPAAFEAPLTARTSKDFGYIFSKNFSERPDEQSRLPDKEETIPNLLALGDAMGEIVSQEPDPQQDRATPGDATIPAGYTYFGQFVDHDITANEALPGGSIDQIFQSSFLPLQDLSKVGNARTPMVELDSLYGPAGHPNSPVPAPHGPRMVVGPVTKVTTGQPPFAPIPGKSRFNDLPRKPRSTVDKLIDREARIGDPRNDENLIVAQLHLAFLKAHNTLGNMLGDFSAARTTLTKIYQSVILDDYLRRICDHNVLDDIEDRGPQFFAPTGALFMPVEFSAAAFRFGHSMIRSRYDFNLNFRSTDSSFAFVFSALSGQLGFGIQPTSGTDTFPDNWILQWERFLPINGSLPQRARPIDPKLTPVLFSLRTVTGEIETGNIAPHLAKRNLLRGYLFGLPTGQAMAQKFGVSPIVVSAATSGLPDSAFKPFADRTPLWFYILVEAKLNNGRLGAVGSRIVGETLHTLIRRSTPSIFNSNGTRNFLGRHKLSDIINLAAIQDTEEALGEPSS